MGFDRRSAQTTGTRNFLKKLSQSEFLLFSLIMISSNLTMLAVWFLSNQTEVGPDMGSAELWSKMGLFVGGTLCWNVFLIRRL